MSNVDKAKQELIDAIVGLSSPVSPNPAKAYFDDSLSRLIEKIDDSQMSADLDSLFKSFETDFTYYTKGIDLQRESTVRQLKEINEKMKIFNLALQNLVKSQTPDENLTSLAEGAFELRKDWKIQSLNDSFASIDKAIQEKIEEYQTLNREPDESSRIAESAKSNLNSIDHFPVHTAKKFVESSADLIRNNQNKRTPADALLSTFIKEYSRRLKSDFKSLGGQLIKSRLAFPKVEGFSSDRLTAAIYHAAFNGGKRTEGALRKAGVLAKHGWKANPNLPEEQREAVQASLDAARSDAVDNAKNDPAMKKRVASFDRSIGKSKARPGALKAGLKAAENNADNPISNNRDAEPDVDANNAQRFEM